MNRRDSLTPPLVVEKQRDGCHVVVAGRSPVALNSPDGSGACAMLVERTQRLDGCCVGVVLWLGAVDPDPSPVGRWGWRLPCARKLVATVTGEFAA